VLTAARPSFHEWTTASYKAVPADSTVPSAQKAPLVGDFDGDGASDVVFAGTDSAGPSIVAVLSHRGQPVVAPVTTQRELAVDIDLRRSRLASAVSDFQGRRREMIDVHVWDDGGRIAVSARFIYEKGRFSVLAGGE
jgi:hypothetical protein